ncbi:MAG: hypothetical protein EP350_03465 [Alphaproteobacteria bacterium]|nr:MAG: hypothetical protein EP350_03465 [Alphaproteobacteria bacterium]
MALAPLVAEANTRADASPVYYVAAPNAQPELQSAPERKKRKAGLISGEDLSSVLLLAGGFGLAFGLILAGGSSSGGNTPNQSNGAN